jgi:hypothetical protein
MRLRAFGFLLGGDSFSGRSFMKRCLLVSLAVLMSASLAHAYAGTSPIVPVPPPPPATQQWIPAIGDRDRDDLQAAVAQAIQRARFRNCVVGTEFGGWPFLAQDATTNQWYLDYSQYKVFRSGTGQRSVRFLSGREPADSVSEHSSSYYTEILVALAPDDTVTSVRIRKIFWENKPVFAGVFHPIKTITTTETQLDGLYCATSAE